MNEPRPESGSIATRIADSLERSAPALVGRWLERLRQRLEEKPRRIFPDDTLLNHMPEVITAFARAVRAGRPPEEHGLVQAELSRLAILRWSQGYSLEELIVEFDILEEIVSASILDELEQLEGVAPPVEAARAMVRLHEGLKSLARVTTRTYVGVGAENRSERARILESFGRAVTHELRNRLHTCVLLLRAEREGIERGASGAADALDRLEQTLRKLESVVDDVTAVTLARHGPAGEGGMQRFDELVDNLAGELQDLAHRHGVEIRVRRPLPDFFVDAPRLQLVLLNLLANATKYSDPGKDERWVQVSATETSAAGEWRIEVADNGIGIPAGDREAIFEEGFRTAEAQDTAEGEGLGLSLAQGALSQLGARLAVRGAEGRGTTFSFVLREPRPGLDPQ